MLDHGIDLVGKGKRKLLRTGQLNAVEDDDARRLVERSRELLVPDHLGDDGRYLPKWQRESLGKDRKGKGSVVRSIREQVGSQPLLLNTPM